MSTFNPSKFQKDALVNLTEMFVSVWKKEGRQLPIVFKSPTGSGKTFMTSLLIRGLNHLPQWKEDKAFIWITFSDDLAMQSKDKFLEYFENMLENRTLTVADINQGKLNQNDILFLNWQKITAKSAETRLLRRPNDEEWRKEQGKYFEDVIEQTHSDGRQIILVIDEAHKNKDTKLAKDIIDKIDPKIILHITATPNEADELTARRLGSYYEVPRKEVVEQGLIKEAIVTQTIEDFKGMSGKDLDKVLLENGIKKREELKAELRALGKDINPLMLIQIPNDDNKLIEKGEQTKEVIVTDYLLRMKVPEGKIAKWSKAEDKPKGLEDNNDDHDFLIFKQTAGTGWDCPRASVLVMFREIQSNTFYTQTVGRILRMPEPQAREDYKNNPKLRLGYLYTNHKRKEVVIPDQNPANKPLTEFAHRKKGIKNIELPSDYISRLDYGDIRVSSKFQEVFRTELNKHFGITNGDILGKAEAKLEKVGLDLSDTLVNEVIANARFEDYDNLAFDFRKKGNDFSLEMSVSDIEKTFNYLCYQLLKEQEDDRAKYSNVARSWSVLKQALRVWFKMVLPDDHIHWYKVFIKDVRKGTESKFRPAITKALRAYKPISDKLLTEKKKKVEEKEAYTFTIQEEYQYPEDYKVVPQKLNVLDKFYLPEDYNGRKNEVAFVEYLEKKKGGIDWWFKNGNQGKSYLGIKYTNSSTKDDDLFYPDWIIRFSNGRIGIFDTKKGDTATSTETADKARALQQKLKGFGKKFIGGIAVQEAELWYYNNRPKYSFKDGQSVNDSKDWKPFEDLF
ncbi:MAG TPA: DEAD/DEAH box helicase family protein [Candidatus Paceibacterota bacterium]